MQLVQVVFKDSMLPVEIAWAMMVLIPKRNGGYRGIGLVKVL